MDATNADNQDKHVIDILRDMFGDEVIDAGIADGSIVVYDAVDGDDVLSRDITGYD